MVDSNTKMVTKRDADRIGALPDSVLHNILSFLDMKEVVGTSLISTRWRNLWVSSPILNFDHSLWKRKNRIKKNKRLVKNKFMNFIDQVLFLHDGSNITKFNISCSTYCDFDRFGAWMTIAARKQIQEIHIDLVHYNAGESESRELPDAIFCPGVTVFKFNIWPYSYNGYTEIRVPNSIFLSPRLKTLELAYVEFPQGNANGELVLSCPVLETLELVGCKIRHLNVLDISALQLKNLAIYTYHHDRSGFCQVKIFTPVLVSLTLHGMSTSYYSVGSFSSLAKAKITNLCPPSEAPYLIKLLESISCAATIELSADLQDPIHDVSQMVTISFSNVRYLTLGDPLNPCSKAMVKLFKSSPCIETLVLINFDMKDWQECFYHFNFDHLKSLEICWLKRNKYEIDFLEYLLENAVVLEKLTIRMGYCKGKFVERINDLVKGASNRVVLSISK